jgi:hypothetical protein
MIQEYQREKSSQRLVQSLSSAQTLSENENWKGGQNDHLNDSFTVLHSDPQSIHQSCPEEKLRNLRIEPMDTP